MGIHIIRDVEIPDDARGNATIKPSSCNQERPVLNGVTDIVVTALLINHDILFIQRARAITVNSSTQRAICNVSLFFLTIAHDINLRYSKLAHFLHACYSYSRDQSSLNGSSQIRHESIFLVVSSLRFFSPIAACDTGPWVAESNGSACLSISTRGGRVSFRDVVFSRRHKPVSAWLRLRRAVNYFTQRHSIGNNFQLA